MRTKKPVPFLNSITFFNPTKMVFIFPPLPFINSLIPVFKTLEDPLDIFYLCFGLLRESIVDTSPRMKWVLMGKTPPN